MPTWSSTNDCTASIRVCAAPLDAGGSPLYAGIHNYEWQATPTGMRIPSEAGQ